MSCGAGCSLRGLFAQKAPLIHEPIDDADGDPIELFGFTRCEEFALGFGCVGPGNVHGDGERDGPVDHRFEQALCAGPPERDQSFDGAIAHIQLGRNFFLAVPLFLQPFDFLNQFHRGRMAAGGVLHPAAHQAVGRGNLHHHRRDFLVAKGDERLDPPLAAHEVVTGFAGFADRAPADLNRLLQAEVLARTPK